MRRDEVHCLGAVVVDALSHPLDAYPVPGVRTQANTESLTMTSGGGAANSAAALAQLGIPAAVFSKVGDDPHGAFLLREIERHGVDTRGIRVSPDDTTPFTYVGIHPDGQRTFIHTPGANKTFSIRDLDLDRLLDCGYLLYQDLCVLPQLDAPSGADILAAARRRGVVTLLDECWGFGPDRALWERVAPHADFLLPSFDDMRILYPGASPDEIADRLLSLGGGTVVLKMGAEGCLLASAGTRRRVPACPVNVVDTTGAGDCFDAGFLAGLVHGMPPEQAAEIAAAAAAACIGHIGASTGIPPFETLAAGAGCRGVDRPRESGRNDEPGGRLTRPRRHTHGR